ncbi:MAG: sigma 54-interacting transcriptional regulator [Vicinamibacteraceae bacterium]|nr:sigma 54-interacting transcriptional regulator [Vicinamibacteraceae bacterium]
MADFGDDHRSVDSLLDSLPDGAFTVDREWRITAFNKAAERITGLSRAEVVGRPCHDVLQSSICRDGCGIRRALASGDSVMLRSLTIATRDGTRVPICISAGVVRDQGGEVVGAIETFRELARIETIDELRAQQAIPGFVGSSPIIAQLFHLVGLVAATDSTALIEGESGTGKELVAHAIHQLSHRATRPLVAVDCGALPDTLLESELFGHRAGSFTDARRDKPGRFEVADGGTLFLDEIGEVSPALQLRLLRVLQEREIEPLGSTKPVRVDVRILAATNRDLYQRVEQGFFRRDLFYRLNVVTITVPPLRERLEDLPLLIDAFLHKLNEKRTRRIDGVSPEVMAILLAHDYPGNVRELHNILEHAAIFCTEGVILPRHLPHRLAHVQPPAATQVDPVSALQRSLIVSALGRNHGNRRAAARELGIHPTTLWRRAQRLGIALPEEDGRSSSGS